VQFETRALYALMLFNAARFDTRFDAYSRAIELEYQDRSLWDSSLIKLANKSLMESDRHTRFPRYHLASIGIMHCAVEKFEDTSGTLICKIL